MFEYDEESMRAVEVLDKHDLSPFLINCRGVDIYELKDNIPTDNEEIKNAFEILTADEVAGYLREKYGMYLQEEIRSYIWWNKNSGRK